MTEPRRVYQTAEETVALLSGSIFPRAFPDREAQVLVTSGFGDMATFAVVDHLQG